MNFQNALLAGGTFPTGSILTVGPGGALTLTTGVDTPTAGFSADNGATATQPGATFTALPGTNVIGRCPTRSMPVTIWRLRGPPLATAR